MVEGPNPDDTELVGQVGLQAEELGGHLAGRVRAHRSGSGASSGEREVLGCACPYTSAEQTSRTVGGRARGRAGLEEVERAGGVDLQGPRRVAPRSRPTLAEGRQVVDRRRGWRSARRRASAAAVGDVDLRRSTTSSPDVAERCSVSHVAHEPGPAGQRTRTHTTSATGCDGAVDGEVPSAQRSQVCRAAISTPGPPARLDAGVAAHQQVEGPRQCLGSPGEPGGPPRRRPPPSTDPCGGDQGRPAGQGLERRQPEALLGGRIRDRAARRKSAARRRRRRSRADEHPVRGRAGDGRIRASSAPQPAEPASTRCRSGCDAGERSKAAPAVGTTCGARSSRRSAT